MNICRKLPTRISASFLNKSIGVNPVYHASILIESDPKHPIVLTNLSMSIITFSCLLLYIFNLTYNARQSYSNISLETQHQYQAYHLSSRFS